MTEPDEDTRVHARCETCEQEGLECPQGFDLERWSCPTCNLTTTVVAAACLLEAGVDTTPPCSCGCPMERRDD